MGYTTTKNSPIIKIFINPKIHQLQYEKRWDTHNYNDSRKVFNYQVKKATNFDLAKLNFIILKKCIKDEGFSFEPITKNIKLANLSALIH